MKKYPLLLLILLSLVFFSCEKDYTKDTPDYYVKYKLNGVSVSNTKSTYCWLQPNNTIPGMVDFQLFANTNDFKHGLGITVQQTGGVTTGTYNSDNFPSYIVIADYFKDQGQSQERDYAIDPAPGMPASTFTVTITAITDKSIKGTFTGNYLYDRGYNESLQITDGEFFVKRNN